MESKQIPCCSLVTEKPYRELTCYMLFLSKTYRPDIGCTISSSLRLIEKGTENHGSVANRVIHYLSRTKYYGFIYQNV